MKKIVSFVFTLVLATLLMPSVAAYEPSSAVTLIRFAQLETKRAGQIGNRNIDTSIEALGVDENGETYAKIGGWVMYFDLNTLVITHGFYDFEILEDNIEKTGAVAVPMLPGLSVFEYPLDDDIDAIKQYDYNVIKTHDHIIAAMENPPNELGVIFEKESILYKTGAYYITIEYYNEQNKSMARMSAHLAKDIGDIKEPVAIEQAQTKPNLADDIIVESTIEKTIQFRGLDWYITKKEAEEVLVAQGVNKAYLSSNEHDIYRLSAIDFPNSVWGDELVDDGGFRVSYSGLDVAGYKPDVYACYHYHVEDGIIDRDDDKAVFYFGWYVFRHGDFADFIAIFDDLKTKLSSLYGEPENDADKYHITAIWHDQEGNTLQLLTDHEYGYITLGYVAAGADVRLDAVQVALDTEKAAAEAAERKKNKDNTDGL